MLLNAVDENWRGEQNLFSGPNHLKIRLLYVNARLVAGL